MIIHVIIVVPYYVEWDLGFLVIVDNIFYNRKVMVTPSALVESCRVETEENLRELLIYFNFVIKLFLFWVLPTYVITPA